MAALAAMDFDENGRFGGFHKKEAAGIDNNSIVAAAYAGVVTLLGLLIAVKVIWLNAAGQQIFLPCCGVGWKLCTDLLDFFVPRRGLAERAISVYGCFFHF